MWLVRIALSRPYTFIVLALMILIIGVLSILRTPTDIFPSIDIPVVSVVWSYSGMPPDDMANRITSIFERAVTTTVNNIEHIESETLIGVNVIKLFFQPGVDVPIALSQVTAVSQTILKSLPPGTLPPLILSYDASTVPVMQLVLSSHSLPEQVLYDLGSNFIRPRLATVQGAALPQPYGGKVRQICVDLDTQAMQTYGVSAQNVNQALNNQNLIIPAGTQKIGPYEYIVKLNAVPKAVEEFNAMPVLSTPNRIIYMRDIAHVRDGFAPQINVVHVDGQRAVLMPVEKTGRASTLNIISRVKNLLPIIKANMPDALDLSITNDQSLFVTAAITSVLREVIIAAALTSLMILLFLGSVRSTFIIAVSIPLAMLSSIILLSMLGETLNIMTLGGLALAVGILVDDATVVIENINWNLAEGKTVSNAILDGGQQIALPALVSTLCICIVFIPMFFLGGVARYLFVPLAEAVVFGMLASYLLSRSLVPTLANYLIQEPESESEITHKSAFKRFHLWFEAKFEAFRQEYHAVLERALRDNKTFIIGFLSFVLGSILILWPALGTNFFPQVDAGQMKLHLHAPTGTRVEETARLASNIDNFIRAKISNNMLDKIVDNIGLPMSGINLSYSNSGTTGPEDADIFISLKPGHRPTQDYIRELRKKLPEAFPGIDFSFLPADIVNQILNFGLPSAINIEIMGSRAAENHKYATHLLTKLKHIPGIVDARIQQANNYPSIFVAADRSRAKQLGFDEKDIATNLLLSLSGSFQTAPNFWVDPKNGVSYSVVTQTPQYAMDSMQTLKNTPITNMDKNTAPQILSAMATITTTRTPSIVSHYNVQPVIDIYADTQDRDLGSVTKDINRLIKSSSKDLPKGSEVILRGQIETQHNAFFGLYFGLLFSIVIVYLLIVINFQSWLDPFIIISALPAALAGICWMLFVTHTTLSVPALTGAIMCMGVATANSILVVSFAKSNLKDGKSPLHAALDAGFTRMRPVLMTALAMVIGMLPMALGLGEGGEQNAPLGRAVIGGLTFSTVATLLFVPTVFCAFYNRKLYLGEHHDKDH